MKPATALVSLHLLGCGLRAGEPTDPPPPAARAPTVTTASAPKVQEEKMPALPLTALTRASELAAHDGEVVVLRGVYRQLSLPQKMGGQPRPTELAAIELEGRPSEAIADAWDGEPMQLLLGDGARPSEEIERLRDRRVEVRGTLQLRPPLTGPADVSQALPPPTLSSPGAPIALPDLPRSEPD